MKHEEMDAWLPQTRCARVYRACEGQRGGEAQDIVFADDPWRHVDGAQRCGWQTVHFDLRTPALSYDRVMQLLEAT